MAEVKDKQAAGSNPTADYDARSAATDPLQEFTENREADVGRAAHGVRDTMSDTLDSAADVGGSTVSATRNVVKSVITVTEEVGNDLVDGVRSIAKNVVSGVADVGGDSVAAVGGLGRNAVNTLTELLVDVVGGVRQIAGSAVRGRRDVGEEPAFRSKASVRAGRARAERDDTVQQSQPMPQPPADSQQSGQRPSM